MQQTFKFKKNHAMTGILEGLQIIFNPNFLELLYVYSTQKVVPI